ncbi:hypothetical protein DTO207G8_6234 [Paecilomyces variotii]|nr:hypothetical protein DTO207G8_6234 [Paecilomyces variotii]
MAVETGHRSSLQVLQTGDIGSFLNPRISTPQRPLSNVTEIFDTDYDEDYVELYAADSPRGSLATKSISTVSTEEVQTPGSTGLDQFQFHFDEKPVMGPVGPHLFRSSLDGSDIKSSFEVDFILEDSSPVSPAVGLGPSTSAVEAARNQISLRNEYSRQPTISQPAIESHETDVGSWTPTDVVKWLQDSDFDESIVEKFFINDISGAILLELQAEDLKELEIHSFGKRRRLMNSIQQLRNGGAQENSVSRQSPPESSRSSSQPASHHSSTPPRQEYNCSPSSDDKNADTPTRERRRKHRHHRRNTEDVRPGESASIVAIEQLLPKIHSCSKGRDCPKWQRQQRKLARLAQDLPIESLESLSGGSILTGDPGNPATAPNLVRQSKSDMSPSIVASSDVLGPNTPEFQISEQKLSEVQKRDPQENVRQFLNFQHLNRLQPVNNPASPPAEAFASPVADSPDSVKTNVTLTENLRNLPKLRIPSMNGNPAPGSFSATLSAQRTITPSVLHKRRPFSPQGATPVSHNQPNYGSMMSPSEYYRQESVYRQGTPFSEMDVPITAVPLGPIPRQESQSVPPDMRFGSDFMPRHDPIQRPSSTKVDNHRRNTSQNVPTLDRLDETDVYDPIETPEDLSRTPRATNHGRSPFTYAPRNANDVTHSGWMKKRKTTRLLRHEWEDHHFVLKGTQLSMYADERDSRRDSKALEYIDVDDYAVACSSLASSSKLTAAFKKTVLKRRENTIDEAAFAFSLIPSTNNTATVDRKAIFTNGKSHHFAVKTRDERIDWMRELMLAKALKRGKEDGDSIQVNGNNV